MPVELEYLRRKRSIREPDAGEASGPPVSLQTGAPPGVFALSPPRISDSSKTCANGWTGGGGGGARDDPRLHTRALLERPRDRPRHGQYPHLREGGGHRLQRALGGRRPERRSRGQAGPGGGRGGEEDGR